MAVWSFALLRLLAHCSHCSLLTPPLDPPLLPPSTPAGPPAQVHFGGHFVALRPKEVEKADQTGSGFLQRAGAVDPFFSSSRFHGGPPFPFFGSSKKNAVDHSGLKSIPTSVRISRESPDSYGGLVFGRCFWLDHRSGHFPPSCANVAVSMATN